MAKDKDTVKMLKRFTLNKEAFSNEAFLKKMIAEGKIEHVEESNTFIFNKFSYKGIDVFCSTNKLGEFDTFVIDTNTLTKDFTLSLYDIESEDVISQHVKEQFFNGLMFYVDDGFIELAPEKTKRKKKGE